MLQEHPALPEVIPTALVSMPLQSIVLLQDSMATGGFQIIIFPCVVFC